jgi:hypothetical protein
MLSAGDLSIGNRLFTFDAAILCGTGIGAGRPVEDTQQGERSNEKTLIVIALGLLLSQHSG